MEQHEEEIIDVDPHYKRGFEQGYWLQRGNSPELQNIMQAAANHQREYADGLKAGSQEARREAFRQRMDEHDQQRENDKDREVERD